jgi:hypothetical protein
MRKAPALPVPLEEIEQRIFVQWLELNNLTFTALPLSTFTTSWKVKMRNKVTGVRPGIPDVVIAIPKVGLLFIELKRVKGGVVSSYQKAWIDTLNECPGTYACVAYGAASAIAIVESYLPYPAKVRFKDNAVF